jgi:hypothetical protein
LSKTNVSLGLHSRQQQAAKILNKPDVVDVCYGGAKGGGKSFFLCFWVYWFCNQLIDKLGLKPTDKPPHVGFMGRKQSVDFTGTTLQTWQEVIPAATYKLRGATDRYPKHILLNNTVAVDYGGFDRSETVNKFNSAEYIFVAIDQAEELTKDDVAVLRASRRMKIKGKEFHYKGLWTANPAQCWLQTDFITDPPPQNKFIQALPADNPHLPSSYIGMLTEAFKHRPELLAAYLHGDWESMEGPTQMIKSVWLRDAAARGERVATLKHFLVCDPAGEGDDECVIFRMKDAEIEEKKIMPYCKTTEMSNYLAREAMKYNIPVVVESIGADLGKGVIDELEGFPGIIVMRYNPAAASQKKIMIEGKPHFKYGNVRAEAWDTAARCLCDGTFEDSNCMLVTRNMYQLLRDQLCQPTYHFKGTKLYVEKKTEIKKRLGRSPDHGDTYVMALWAWKKIIMPPERKKAKEAHAERQERFSSPFAVR